MKSFLRQIIIFSSPLYCIMLALIYLDYSNYQLISDHKLPTEVDTIFIGDSHIETSINDSLYKNILNIASSGEGYIYTYYKLINIVKNNSNIKTVILGFSYHNLSSYFDKAIYGENSISNFSDNFFIIPFLTKINLIAKNKSLIINSMDEILKKGIKNLNVENGKYSFLGGYSPVTSEKLINSSTIQNRINQQFYYSKSISEFSSLNLEYLLKIIAFCKQKEIKLFLLNTPIHPEYYKGIPIEYHNQFHTVLKKNKVNLINFESVDLGNKYYLPDGDHVNQEGANTTTKLIINYISSLKKNE